LAENDVGDTCINKSVGRQVNKGRNGIGFGKYFRVISFSAVCGKHYIYACIVTTVCGQKLVPNMAAA